MSSVEASRGLASEELAALREESANARRAQQAILQWSIGALAVLFAGTLAAAGSKPGGVAAFLGFGLIIPGVAVGASLAWLGEVVRMERVGRYLRGRERAFWHSNPRDPVVKDGWVQAYEQFPTLWENHIAFGEQAPRANKQLVGYVGAVWIYAGSLATSIGIFILLVQIERGSQPWEIWHAAVTLYGVVFVSAWFIYFVGQSKALLDIGIQAAGVFDERHLTWKGAVAAVIGRPVPRNQRPDGVEESEIQ